MKDSHKNEKVSDEQEITPKSRRSRKRANRLSWRRRDDGTYCHKDSNVCIIDLSTRSLVLNLKMPTIPGTSGVLLNPTTAEMLPDFRDCVSWFEISVMDGKDNVLYGPLYAQIQESSEIDETHIQLSGIQAIKRNCYVKLKLIMGNVTVNNVETIFLSTSESELSSDDRKFVALFVNRVIGDRYMIGNQECKILVRIIGQDFVCGYKTVLELIKNNLKCLEDGHKSHQSMLLVGPNGCGKSLILEAVENVLKINRFQREIEINVPSTEDRLAILTRHIPSLHLDENEKFNFSQVTHGFTCSDLILAIKQISSEDLMAFQPNVHNILNVMKSTRPSALRDIIPNKPFNTKWSDIAGCEQLKKQLLHMLVWPFRYPQIFDSIGIRPPTGILLYGPPGCSKTMVARAIANESHLNFFSIKGPEIFSKWVGDSEKAIRQIFERARMVAPSIVFFDEIDAIATERSADYSSGSSNVGARVVAQLLTEMDGLEYDTSIKVIVIAATNRPDVIDSALMRPGRFDRLIYVPLPNEDTRWKIFEIHLKKLTVDESVRISDLVNSTDGYSGAEVVAVCREAVLSALEDSVDLSGKINKGIRVRAKHFDDAFKLIQPRTDFSILAKFERLSTKQINLMS
ncbi:hypothetical protein ACOME3_004361 [Neoechinorhynchus agilis]